MEGNGTLLQLFLVFAAAKAAGEVFERLRQPAVVGELLAGVVLGPSLLGWVRPGATLETLSAVGVVMLLFLVGLETRASDLLKVGRTALLAAVAGVAVPFAAGYAYLATLGEPPSASLFVGAALVATSVGVTARVLSDAGLVSTRAARIVLAAAVIDDVLGLVVLAVVTGAAGGGVDVAHLGLVLGATGAFAGFQVLVAPRLVVRHAHLVERLRCSHAPLAVALAALLGLAALTEMLGLAAIVGAFFAGMAFADTRERWGLETHVRPIADFLVPFFFVTVGTHIDVRLLAQPAVLVPGLTLAAIAIATKVAGCGAGALGEGPRRALAIGVGMVPRGEVGLIVASAGLAAGVVTPGVYAMVVLATVVTTLVAPPLLPAVFARATSPLPAIPASSEAPAR